MLGDPDRRRRYDADLAAHERSATNDRQGPDHHGYGSPAAGRRLSPRYDEPARFPWKFMAAMASVGIAVILVGVIVYDPPPPTAPDGVLRHGDCVMLSDDFVAVEVTCGRHDAVVDRLIPIDQVCPANTEPYRDRPRHGHGVRGPFRRLSTWLR